MLHRAEAGGDGDGQHGQAGLLQQLPRPLQPQLAVEALERAAEMGGEQALELARGDAERGRRLSPSDGGCSIERWSRSMAASTVGLRVP